MSRRARVRSWGNVVLGLGAVVVWIVMLIIGPREDSNWGETSALILMMAAMSCRFVCESFARTRRWGRRAARILVCVGMGWVIVAYVCYEVHLITLFVVINLGILTLLPRQGDRGRKKPSGSDQPLPDKGYRTRLIKRYPELACFETIEAFDEAWKYALGRAARSGRVWVLAVSSFVALNLAIHAAAFAFAVLVEPPRLARPALVWLFRFDGTAEVLIVLWCVTELMLFAGAWIWVARSATRRALRERLMSAGIPVCTKCAYDLRFIGSDRCPECGQPCRDERR